MRVNQRKAHFLIWRLLLVVLAALFMMVILNTDWSSSAEPMSDGSKSVIMRLVVGEHGPELHVQPLGLAEVASAYVFVNPGEEIGAAKAVGQLTGRHLHIFPLGPGLVDQEIVEVIIRDVINDREILKTELRQ